VLTAAIGFGDKNRTTASTAFRRSTAAGTPSSARTAV